MAIRLKRLLIIRKVIKLGASGIGYFEDCKFRHAGNRVFVTTITFSYNDENGVPHITKTLKTYNERETKHLEQMREFKILYYQKHAVIDEDMRDRSHVVQASNSRAAQAGGAAAVAEQQPRAERCRYCNTKLSVTALNCRGCGANA